MRGRNTIIINGKLYDAVSGLPLGASDARSASTSAPVAKPVKSSKTISDIGPGAILHRAAATARPTAPSAKVHRKVQKSTTLRRDVLRKPASTAAHVGSLRRKPTAGHVARSNMVSKFAPHPKPLTDAKPVAAPVKSAPAPKLPSQVAKTHKLVAEKKAVSNPQLSSRALKEKMIAEKLAEADNSPAKTKKGGLRRQPRSLSIVAACLAVVILGGYMTYLNMPNLSVRVAAAQAGVAAKFPDYHPAGYSFDGPIAYTNGEVTIRFKANGGDGGYTLREQSSSWDSQAVYDNLVAKESGGSHITNRQNGLTVYTYESNAAWVNGGVLYVVEGDAPLSNEQLLRIAGSM